MNEDFTRAVTETIQANSEVTAQLRETVTRLVGVVEKLEQRIVSLEGR